MADPWLESLGQLTGEETYNLVAQLDRWEALVCQAGRNPRLPAEQLQALNRYVLELIEIRQTALVQIARIVIPLAEAQAIVYRTLYARRRAVRVVPT